jgi:Na+/melibiose symporter-like transporter
MIGTFFVVSVFLQVSRGYSAIETGLALTPATAGILISSARAETLVKKYSQRTIIRAGFLITLAGIVALLVVTSTTASILLFALPLLVIGFGAGIMLTASVNVVQSSVPEADQGSLSGLSRSVSNLGSSMGTAVAGAILISALIAGTSDLTHQSDVLSPDQQQQIDIALQGNVTALSDAQVQEILQDQPPAIVDEVTRINADARDRALGLALASVAIIGLVGLLAAFMLPAQTVAEKQPSTG